MTRVGSTEPKADLDSVAEDLASSGQPGDGLRVRARIRLVGGEAGQALAAAQGRALRVLLAHLAEGVVGPGGEEE